MVTRDVFTAAGEQRINSPQSMGLFTTSADKSAQDVPPPSPGSEVGSSLPKRYKLLKPHRPQLALSVPKPEGTSKPGLPGAALGSSSKAHGSAPGCEGARRQSIEAYETKRVLEVFLYRHCLKTPCGDVRNRRWGGQEGGVKAVMS